MSGLSNLFSTSTLTKFERKVQPVEVEFPSKIRDPSRPDREEEHRRLEKKANKKRKRVEKDEAAGEEGGVVPAEDSEVAVQSDGKDSKTLFVGNLPVDQTVKTISAIFKEFGDVESVRLRSVPTAGAKVDQAGNQDLVRKVSINKKMFGDQKGSFNAYVVYQSNEAVSAALAANGRLVGERHIRCDRIPPSLFNQKQSVFVGNLPHYTDEEELRTHFANAMPNGQDDVDSVRLVRDPETLVGKGIGGSVLYCI
jgi:nucleolar protein 12